MLQAPAMILGVKGTSNQLCIRRGGGMREFAGVLRKCPRTSGQDCSHCPPLLRQAMLKVPAMILGVKGPSNQHCIAGGGRMRQFAGFLRKYQKTFRQDCSYRSRPRNVKTNLLFYRYLLVTVMMITVQSNHVVSVRNPVVHFLVPAVQIWSIFTVFMTVMMCVATVEGKPKNQRILFSTVREKGKKNSTSLHLITFFFPYSKLY